MPLLSQLVAQVQERLTAYQTLGHAELVAVHGAPTVRLEMEAWRREKIHRLRNDLVVLGTLRKPLCFLLVPVPGHG